MTAGTDPQAQSAASRIELAGIANSVDLGDITADLSTLNPQHNTFPGEVLLQLANE